MKLRRTFIIAIAFIFVSLFTLSFNVSANAVETSELITVQGAQIRTTGNAGIRFVAKEEYPGLAETAYGIIIAFGEVEASDEFVIGATINDKSVLKGEVTTTKEGEFTVTLYNVPEEFYIQKVSARAYVIDGENVVYSQNVVVKSLAEVALKAKADENNEELVNTVVDYVDANYMRHYTLNNEVVLSKAISFAEHELFAEFVKDFNATVGTSLATNMSEKAFFLGITNCPEANYKQKNSSVTDISQNPLFKFFKNEAMYKKWSPFITYVKERGTANPHIVNQTKALLNAPTFSGVKDANYSYNFYYLEHLTFAIYNYFNQDDKVGYYTTLTWSDNYNGNPFTTKVYTDLADWSLVKVGNSVTLPLALEKTGYTWNGWTDGNNTYSANSEYTVSSNNTLLTPSFTINNYTIKYYNENEEYTELADLYTVEEVVDLPVLPDAAGYVFAGWYDNPELNGNAIQSIAKGTLGNKEYYSKWVFGYDTLVVDDDYALLEEGTKVTVNEVEYTVGQNAQSSVAKALEYAKENATIYVAAGTYDDSFAIAKNGIKILGPNANVNGSSNSRVEEAIFTNATITLETGLSNVVFNGVKFTGSSKFADTVGVVGIDTAVSTNLTNFSLLYSVVDGGSANSFIDFVSTNYSYNVGTTIKYNYITQSVAEGPIHLFIFRNERNINISNNEFSGLVSNAIWFDDQNKGFSGLNINICDNTFNNIASDALYIDWLSPDYASKSSVYNLNNNTFTNITGNAIYIARIALNTNVDGVRINLENNTFKALTGSALFVKRVTADINTSLSVNIYKNYFEDVAGGACLDFDGNGTNTQITSAHFVVHQNTFKEVWKGLYVDYITGVKFTNNIYHKYTGSLTASNAYVCRGTSRCTIDASSNLYYLANDTVTLDPYADGFVFNSSTVNSVTNINTINYASLDAYNAAIDALEN